MWTRSVLCRLCKCPASDGGVRLDQLDAVKLTMWWRRTLGTDFVANKTLDTREIICNFCIWDARLEKENSADNSPYGFVDECNWWSEHDDNQFFQTYYYQEEVIQRCIVKLGPAAIPTFSSATLKEQNTNLVPCKLSGKADKLKVLYQCFLCDHQAFDKHQHMLLHMRKNHAGQFIQCKHNGRCARVFRTEEEKKEHTLKDHKPMKKCDFCHRKYTINMSRSHMEIYHKNDNLFSCSYQFCDLYFRSEEVMEKHEELIHAVGEKMTSCMFCGLLFKCMKNHLRSKHKQQLPDAFKCIKETCFKYFLTQNERDEHVADVHTKKIVVREEVKCIYCKKMCADKYLLHQHVNYYHYEFKIQCKFSRCSRYFHTQVRADAHFEQMHRKKEENKMFQCSKCDFKSARKDGIQTHEAQRHVDKTIPCPKCEKLFGSIKLLNFHLYTHNEPKICEHCNEKITLTGLRKHQQQEKCRKCQEVLFCSKSARRHDKICKLSV